MSCRVGIILVVRHLEWHNDVSPLCHPAWYLILWVPSSAPAAGACSVTALLLSRGTRWLGQAPTQGPVFLQSPICACFASVGPGKPTRSCCLGPLTQIKGRPCWGGTACDNQTSALVCTSGHGGVLCGGLCSRLCWSHSFALHSFRPVPVPLSCHSTEAGRASLAVTAVTGSGTPEQVARGSRSPC